MTDFRTFMEERTGLPWPCYLPADRFVDYMNTMMDGLADYVDERTNNDHS